MRWPVGCLNGGMGVIVPAGDFQLLAAGLEKGLRELDDMQPRLIRNRILENFSLQKMVTATENHLIEECRREGGRTS